MTSDSTWTQQSSVTWYNVLTRSIPMGKDELLLCVTGEHSGHWRYSVSADTWDDSVEFAQGKADTLEQAQEDCEQAARDVLTQALKGLL